MPLGADDVEASDVNDLLVLGVGLLLEMVEDAVPVGSRRLVERVEMIEVDELAVVREALFAFRQTLCLLLAQQLLARHELGIAAEQDVRSAAGHVRGNRDRAPAPGLGNELRFLRVVLRVEDHVFDAAPLQLRRQPLGLLNRDRADQHRPSRFLFRENVGDDRFGLLFARAVNRVGLFDALQRLVRRNDDDVELVDLCELFRLGLGSAGHARQLLVLAEIVLEGDGGERLIFPLDLHLLFRFDRLVQSVAPASARHQTAGEFVDDHDAAVLDHVVDVELENRVGTQRLFDMVLYVRVLHVVEVLAVQPAGEVFLRRLHPAFGQRDGLVLFVDDVVAGRFERFPFLGFCVAFGLCAGLQLRE